MHRLAPVLACVCAVALTACADPATEARMRGNVHLRSGDLEAALEAYRKAVSLAPEHAGGHYLLANGLAESGDVEGAKSAYARSIELAPGQASADSRRELGILLFHAGDRRGAIARFREVLERRRDDVFTLNRLAEAHAALGEVGEARAIVNSVLRRHPENVPARLTQARLAVAEGDPQSALVVLKGLGDRPFVAYERAAAHAAAGEAAKALEALARALEGADAEARRRAAEDPRLAALGSTAGFRDLVGPATTR